MCRASAHTEDTNIYESNENPTRMPHRIPAEHRPRRSCAIECDQFFKTEFEDVKVVVEFEMVRERELPLRRLDVRVLVEPGVNGEAYGSCGISMLYNIASRQIENVYTCGDNIDSRRVPDLLRVHLDYLTGMDSRYVPFLDPLRRNFLIELDPAQDACSKPN